MNVEQINKDRIYDVYTLLQEQFKDECWTYEQLLQSFNNEYSSVFGITLNETLVSVCITLNSLDDINILYIATKDSFKNNGFAGELIDFIKSKKTKDQTLSVEVKSKNFKAINLYIKHGFETLHIRKKYYKDGDDALCMFCN